MENVSKKLPQRMCCVCRTRNDKLNFIKVVKKDGKFFIDYLNKINGRSAYICKTKECIKKCAKTKALNRSFSCNVDAAVYEELNNLNKD